MAGIPVASIEFIMLGPADDRRQLQDSPILADVWLAYAESPDRPQDLLITPAYECDSADLAEALMERQSAHPGATPGSARLAYLGGLVAATLTFGELLAVVAPLSLWRTTLRQAYDPNDPARREAAEKLIAAASTGKFERSAIEPDGLVRFLALAALIAAAAGYAPGEEDPEPARNGFPTRLAEAAIALLPQMEAELLAPPPFDRAKVFQVALNRKVQMALDRSVAAVKGDAARQLFNINCSKLTWAILDTGIHGDHPALQDKKGVSRVTRTFDFTRLREIIAIDAPKNQDLITQLAEGTRKPEPEIREALDALAQAARIKRPVQWSLVGMLTTRLAPPPPTHRHGTHVAGILGAAEVVDAEGRVKTPPGLCPDIELYDFRVLGGDIQGTEFAVVGALQFIRHLNGQRSTPTIHGANLSLSIPHSVRNYACGRTPVCDEAERLVDSGVVVVAAAGNRGYHNFETANGPFESYAAFSITDPGNAEGVITVGATHRHSPHTYGVSFFSSRGPTGDGRLKPDLVAPGERIRSTVLDGGWDEETGTSMAAPHVSGAAAILMARHSELVGQPRRIKKILCDSATDLGRERSFQGHGMLDVLRALQSI